VIPTLQRYLILSILENPIPATGLAALIAAQALRPVNYVSLLFPPVLLASSYMNVLDYKDEAAGVSSAWSALYLILARRRKQPFMQKWGVRGIIRGATLGLCAANLVGGGFVYGVSRLERRKEDAE